MLPVLTYSKVRSAPVLEIHHFWRGLTRISTNPSAALSKPGDMHENPSGVRRRGDGLVGLYDHRIGRAGGHAVACFWSGPATPAAPETIISAMDGGLIGGSIGSGLRESDRRTALQAEYRALEYSPAGKAVDWQGSGGGVTGSVTAAQPYRVGSQDCRQYTHTVSSRGQNQTARGTACRNPDGSWTPLT